MAKFTLQNVRLFTGAADLTTVNNRVDFNMEAESKDTTAFTATGNTWHEELSGIRTTTVDGAGQWEAGLGGLVDISRIDDSSWAGLGSVGPLTACPATAADGSLAYLTAFNRQSYALGGAVGDVAPWTGKWVGAWPLARGLVIASPTARTSTGTGTIVQLPTAVAANQYLIATLHVMSLSGTTPSVTATVQSAAAIGFASPTTRLTFAAASALGGQVIRVAGPITDQFYRLNYTISGTTPSLLFMSAVGIA